MAVTALIKYTQNAVVGTGGEAYLGATGLLVTVENDDNTDVLSWEIELLYARPGSTLATPPGVPVLLASASSSTPSATFTPDIPGSYRIRLTVYDTAGFTGVSDIDIRNFIVPLPDKGTILPPYQKLPDPLPLSGPGSKPDEMNYGGQAFGWSGDDNLVAKGVNETLAVVDELVGVPDFSLALEGDALQKTLSSAYSFTEPSGAFFDGTHLWTVDNQTPLVRRIDPTNGNLIATIDMSPQGMTQARKVFADGSYVYVANRNDAAITIIDKSTNTVVGLGTTGGGPARGIVSDGVSVWVAVPFGTGVGLQKFSLATILGAFPGSASAATTIAVSGPTEVTLGGGFLWVTNNFWNELVKVDPIGDAVVSTASLAYRTIGVLYAHGFVWVTSDDFSTQLAKFDGTTNPPTQIGSLGSLVNIHGVTADATSVWVGRFDTNTVYRCDLTPSVIATVTGAANDTSYQDMTFDGTLVWAAARTVSSGLVGYRGFSIGLGTEALASTLPPVVAAVDFLPSARIAGDIGGTSATPLVIGLQTFPVSAGFPGFGQYLRWNGSSWASSNIIQLQGNAVSSTFPSGGQVLTWNATFFQWEPQTPSGGGGGGFTTVVTTAAPTTLLSDSDNSIVLVDSLSGARTVNLPASPSAFRQYVIKDRDDNAGTNNITIGNNGNFIDGVAAAYTLATNNGAVYLVYTGAGASLGWRVL